MALIVPCNGIDSHLASMPNNTQIRNRYVILMVSYIENEWAYQPIDFSYRLILFMYLRVGHLNAII